MASNSKTKDNIRVVMTGGGTAGHVIPNIALFPELEKIGCSVWYVASYNGIENDLLRQTGIPVYQIHTGKLRRYFSIRNVTDILFVCAGVLQAFHILRKIRPQVVFSKGGNGAFPLIVAAWMLRIPIVIHESDVSLGLVNKFSANFAHTICVTHENTRVSLRNRNKVIVTGIPLRRGIFLGDKKKGIHMCGFRDNKPVLLFLGGGSGSQFVNLLIEQALPTLLQAFQVAHITGRKNYNVHGSPDYRQFQFVSEIEHLYAAADIVISRAGATTVAELIALSKPNILIPLPADISRGDQVETAFVCSNKRVSRVIQQERMTVAMLMEAIDDVLVNYSGYKLKLQDLSWHGDATNSVANMILRASRKAVPFNRT